MLSDKSCKQLYHTIPWGYEKDKDKSSKDRLALQYPESVSTSSWKLKNQHLIGLVSHLNDVRVDQSKEWDTQVPNRHTRY